jgi:curved DNA-binding protein CbpA
MAAALVRARATARQIPRLNRGMGSVAHCRCAFSRPAAGPAAAWLRPLQRRGGVRMPLHELGRARGLASYSDPYATLGLQRGASQSEVDAAYRKLALKHHPDRNPDNREAAEQKFKTISESYEAISSGAASSPFGAAGGGPSGSTGGFPGGGFPGGGFAGGGFPGGGFAGQQMDPQMEAFLREMMKGPQLSEEQVRQMMAEATRRQGRGQQSRGPGFQGVHYEFSFGGRPNAQQRQPTQAEKEAMEVSRTISCITAVSCQCINVSQPSLRFGAVEAAELQCRTF